MFDPMRIFWDHFEDALGELKPDVGPELGPDGFGGKAGKASSYLVNKDKHRTHYKIVNITL